MSSPTVLVFGAWDRGPAYPRADSLIAGLRQQGFRLHECHLKLPGACMGRKRRQLVAAPWRWPGYLLALRRARGKAIRQLRAAIAAHRPDLVLVPYPGHVVVRWARSAFAGPIILDLFLSAHDTAVSDRGMFHPASPMALVLKRLDRLACLAADLVLVDTPQHAGHVAEVLGCPRGKLDWVPVSDPRESGEGIPYAGVQPAERLEVLFFGTGVPLHGLDTLLRAVERCQRLRLTLIGGSPEDRAQAGKLGMDKVRLLEPFLPDADLRQHLERTHLVAGIFGTSGKAQRVIPLKVMLALSTGRPVLTADTPAVRGLLQPGIDCLVVPPGDVQALAACLQQLADKPECLPPLAAAARRAYDRTFSLARTGARLAGLCRGLEMAPLRRGNAHLTAPARSPAP